MGHDDLDLGNVRARRAPVTSGRGEAEAGPIAAALFQTSVKSIDSHWALSDVERLDQVECGENAAGADQVANYIEIH